MELIKNVNTLIQKLFRVSGLAFLIFSILTFHAFSQDLPEKPNPPRLVNDFAKIFSSEEAQLLELKLRAYNDSTSTQIAVVTITSLDGYPVDDYSFKLGNKWGIGQQGKNNGILVLIAKQDRKAFIATGYGMEGALNDGKLGTILRQEMIPYFKSGDYYGGVNNGIDKMIASAAGEYVADDSGDNSDGPVWPVLIFLATFFLVFVIGMISKVRSAKKYSLLNNVPFWVAWSIINAALNRRNNSGGGGFFGGGSSGGGSSSSFGGFGGGSFGGGGAGGSW